MRTNVLNDLSNVVKKGAGLACSWSQVGRMSEGAPDEHPMSIRSASDGERWKPAGEKGSTRVWKYVAMIFAVLTLSIANIGMAWGDTYADVYTNPASGSGLAGNANGKGAFSVITPSGSVSFGNSSLQIGTSGGSGTFTVASIDGSYITSIAFTSQSSYPINTLTSEQGTITIDGSVYTFTPNSATLTSATFSMSAKSGKKVRVAPITVNLTSDHSYLSMNFGVSSGTVTCTKSSGATDLVLTTTGSASSNRLSFGNGKTLTFTSGDHNIAAIHFTFVNHADVNNVTASTGTFSGSSWTPDSDVKTVTFTSTGSNTIGAISVKLTAAAPEPTCGETTQAALTLSSNSGTICGTGSTTFTVSGGSGSGALSVSSSDASKATASIDGTTVTVTGVAAGSATITVTKACDATYAEATATYSATVAAIPTANAGADKTTEPETGVALAATTAASGCTGAWTIQSGPNTSTAQLSSTSLATATFTPTVAGTYTLRWTVTNTSSSCSAYDEMKVTAAVCSISSCGNATLTYAINASTSVTNTAANLISSATASNTTAMGINSTAALSTITIGSSDNAGKAAAATSTCYPTKPTMSSKIGMYNGSSYSASNYLQFAFTVKTGYTFTPCDIQFTVQPVSNIGNFRWEVTDGTDVYGYGVATNVPKGSDGGASVLTGLTSTEEMEAGDYYIRLYPYYNGSNTFRISNNVILKGTTAAAAPSCTAPTSPSIAPSNGWLYVPGEEITLTASASNTDASTTYTWYRGATLEAAKAAGAIQAAKTAAQGGTTYTIASCTASDAYKYWCEISNGTGCEASASYDIKLYTFFLYNNDNSNNSSHAFTSIDRTYKKLSVTFDVSNATYTYYFKVSDGLGTWYGKNSSTITSATNYCDGLNSSGANVGLTTTLAGSYTVDYYYESNNVVVTYPVPNQTAGQTVYFDNTLTQMSNMYIRIGSTSYSSASSAFTAVPGTAALYQGSTIAWDGFAAWSIADNTGWTDANSIYQPWNGQWTGTGNNYQMSKQTDYQNYAVSGAVTIVPTALHNSEYNCQYYNVDKYNGLLRDRVTITAPVNGTITVNYTSEENVPSSFSATTVDMNQDLAHTVIITPTATPAEGYTLSGLTVNGAAHTSGNTYTVTTNTTIAATFSPASYTVTLNTNGGTINAGNVTSYTYGTGATLPTNVTKSGFTFGGWYDNSGLTGSAVTTISTTATGNKEYWAKWTAAASLTAISADVLYQAADMANITFTGSDQYWAGLSTNNLFQTYGNGTSNSAKGKTISSTNVTDDISTKSFTSHAYIEGSDVTSGTADPTYGAIEFITPSTAGLLYVYTVDGSSSNLKLRKKGSSTFTALTGSSNYNAIAVDANSNYYIHGNASKRGIYGIQYVSTYAVTITPTNVTKATGATGAGAAIKGKAYTATFTANTGYTLPSDVTVTIGGTPATKGTEYTWSVSDGTGTLTVKAANVTGAIAIGVTGDEAAAPTTYTVTFNSNGGSSVSPIEQASEGASISMPANPTRASYEFDGWYTTAGEKISWPYTPTADITLYARWQEACDAEGVAKSTTDVVATGYTTYQEKGGSNVVFTSAPSLGFKYKDADGNTINSSTTAVVRNNAYSCQIKSDSGNKGSIKTNSTFSNVDSISFYFAASDKSGCKIAVWCSTDNFSTDSTSLLSATTYASNNSEFKLKTLAIPAAKKTSALTFKFRFTVTGAGKICYMDSLKVYSSTTGGSTCYHVYYHGNGAESGYVNDTVSYTAGSKATVLNYNYGRYPLAKAGNDFQGWATSADGAVAYTAGQKIDITIADVDLYAVWATASSALVTWKMKTANDEAWATTTGTGTTDGTNISSIGTSHDEGDNKAKNSATAKTALASSASNVDKGADFTFAIGSTKQVEINKLDCQVFNVGGDNDGQTTYKAQISDAAGNVYTSTNSVCPANDATLTDASFVFGSGKILRGAVTIRVYGWVSGSGSWTDFRMGPDVKFYGTVGDYSCATPAAPTISGVSEYVPGQTITLTASHDGENHDNLTTYTWYKGVDWATASVTTPVQAAATGESGYTLTIDDCTTGDAGLYWCKVSNGTGCDAHNSEGYSIIVYPTYTITYNLNGGTNPVDPAPKTSYTQFDEDYTLPTPTKTGSVFAGWYGASDFSGLPTVVLGAGSVGDKEYYAKWGAVVTVSWTVTKVDGELYRGGGGYSVMAVIDQTTWNESYKDQLELTATEGVTLKNIEVSENDESKVQVTADFDITTDLAADATEITFTLNVPADGTYGPKVDEHEETLTSCGGGFDTDNSYVIGKSNSDATNISSSVAFRAYKTASDWYSKGNTTFTDKTSTDGFTISAAEKSYYWQNNGTFTESSSSNCRLRTIKLAKSNGVTIRWTNDELSFSKVRFIGRNTAADDPTTFTVSNGTTEKTFTFEAGNSEIQTKEVTMDFVSGNTKGIVISGGTKEINILIELIPTSVGGVTPTLTWDDGDEDIANDGVSKSTSNDDFVYAASQDKNSLGAITYSSSDVTVATVNSTTGQVHLVGAAGSATITATIAASGCYESASVSYTITVTDDCDDEAGTIETEDLGCPGIKMTVKGHTTTGETVSYQWYKVGTPSDATVGTNQDNFTATEAGSYYVIVTNTGDRHCAKRSTNTITVEAQAAATVTKIVDSWYVKKDRRTPDVELVKTTGATGFTVKIGSTVIWNSDGSNITGFAGCGFRMDENGIIYLNGTKDGSSGTSDNADAPAHGDETWTAGDVTLTITAIGCGSSASQAITIHKQAATSYYDIAFVADGGKGMKKDSITVGHGDGTELYEYLDSVGTAAGNRLFQLSERNIYWTTDEKAIREEYSQFDAILITDDPSTNTVVKTGDDYKTKGYVNAFGTMVDVRPIFTMEAYVSALKNWGSKGIKGSPESPNPRQYEMRLECKDHEIYKSGLPDPEDETNVWEETIGGETFRHVIIVDSTKGVYKGVAYNAETAGNEKPALQGFTGEAAGSLLGLGRILEGTLQAAIERQEEPAARLLVMGINAKALQPTCALTNEGKTVIKNILVYLLKTNMEEVDDCSNYFTGKNSTSWSDPGNWSKESLPSTEAKVRILAPCVISGIQPHVLQVSIVNSGNSNIRNTARGSAVCNGTLTIEPDGALIADGKIRSAVAPHFAANDLMPTTPEILTINTNGSGQAALIFNNEEGLTKATVNLHSLGRNDGSYKYQYFAIPMEYVSVSPAFANETHGGTKIYTYVYNEASSGWTRRGYYDDLYAFEGLGITTKSTVAMNYTMTGTLASTATKEITLTHDGAGLNLIGNSWMAPIQIGALAEDNTDANITKTVYIYCAGRDAVKGEATSGDTETAGQWLAVPFEAAEFETWKEAGKLSVIPAMQAFQIKVSAEATLTLDYDKVVRGSTNDLNAKLRAPRRRVAAKEVTMTNIRVSDSKTHTDISLFEGERFSDEFDNGWEAEYMNGDGRSAKLYAETVDGKMAVVAMTDYEGTMVGFAPGQERVYIFSFMGADNGYYLNDIKMQQSVRISEGETYSFTYEDGDDASRFMISRTPFEKPGVATGTENIDASVPQARKILYNDKLYIIRGGHMYDATGKMVK